MWVRLSCVTPQDIWILFGVPTWKSIDAVDTGFSRVRRCLPSGGRTVTMRSVASWTWWSSSCIGCNVGFFRHWQLQSSLWRFNRRPWLFFNWACSESWQWRCRIISMFVLIILCRLWCWGWGWQLILNASAQLLWMHNYFRKKSNEHGLKILASRLWKNLQATSQIFGSSYPKAYYPSAQILIS